jgi:CRP-like cAMP-binding protein
MKHRVELGHLAIGKAPVWLDLDILIRTRMLIAASSGGGKSYLLRRLLEQTHGKVQQLVLDYEGEFSTLREKFDYVLVGKGGEIATDSRYAPQLIRRLLELGMSAVIDLYELKASERHVFVRVFLEAMINLPKDLWHPCMVVVDEAHVFCPEKGKGESEAAGAVIDLATRGRKRGYCAVLATQDIAKLNKDASGECRNRLIGLAVEDKTRERSGKELGLIDKAEILALRELPAGVFHAFGPAIANKVVRVHIGPVQTSHPEIGTKWAPPPPPREKVRSLLQKLADLPKEAEEEVNTVVRLKQEVARLRADLAHKPTVQVPVTKEVRVEVLILDEGHVRRIESVHQAWQKTSSVLLEQFQQANHDLLESFKSVEKAVVNARSARPAVTVPPTTAQFLHSPSGGFAGPNAAALAQEMRTIIANGRGERLVLAAVAQHPDGVTREQLTVLTGYKRSSRDTYLQRLRASGYVAIAGDRITVTGDGVAELGNDFKPLPVGQELQDYWMQRLPEGERKVLEVIVRAFPDSLERTAIDELTGYRRSSRDTYLQRLRARQLVVDVGRNRVRAVEMLFDV